MTVAVRVLFDPIGDRIEKRGVGYLWVIGLFGIAVFALGQANGLATAMILLAVIAGLAVVGPFALWNFELRMA